MKNLLDYVFPISSIIPTPAASTAYLKQVCLVCKPKSGQEGNVGEVYECTSTSAVAARTDNVNATQLFAGGMSKVYILLSSDLDLEDALNENLNQFYTVIISDDFDDEDLTDGIVTPAVAAYLKIQDITFTAKTAGTGGNSITIDYNTGATAGAEVVGVSTNAISIQIESGVSTAAQIKTAIEAYPAAHALIAVAVDSGDESDPQISFGSAVSLANGAAAITGAGISQGDFEGVIGVQTQDATVAAAQGAIANRCCFLTNNSNKGKNLCYAFGKLLSNLSSWRNQQYITMPFNDDIEELGDANSYFDDKVSFVLHDDQFGNVLALFVAGGKAIVAPYIIKNIMIDIQSKAVQWISGNQPQYTLVEASLLESTLQEKVINSYIQRKLITAGVVEITLVEDNFVASGDINISEPKALWRVFAEMRQTL